MAFARPPEPEKARFSVPLADSGAWKITNAKRSARSMLIPYCAVRYTDQTYRALPVSSQPYSVFGDTPSATFAFVMLSKVRRPTRIGRGIPAGPRLSGARLM